jgi:hypothetical protein
MFCPQCQAEYREGFAVCADCEIPLVAQLADAASTIPPNPEEPAASDPDDSEDPFCKLWEGGDARICADLCSILDEAGIPHRVLRQEAHIFRISPNSQIKLGVPFSCYEKAEQAIAEAFGGAAEAERLLRAPRAD